MLLPLKKLILYNFTLNREHEYGKCIKSYMVEGHNQCEAVTVDPGENSKPMKLWENAGFYAR